MARKLPKTDFALLCVSLTGLAGITLSLLTASADAVTEESTVTVTLGAIIELDAEPVSPGVNDPAYISASPTLSSGFASGQEIVTVSSNNPTGYTASLKMAYDDKDLNYLVSEDTTNYLSGGTVLDTSKNVVAPTASTSLGTNTWGFSLGSANSYTAVPLRTATANNILTGASTPNKGTAAGTDTVLVTFGVRVDFSLTADTTYSNTVQYTATNNPI